MNRFKRAFIYIQGNKGKSITLGLICFITVATIGITTSILLSGNKAMSDYYSENPYTVGVYNTCANGCSEDDYSFTYDEYQKIGENEHVVDTLDTFGGSVNKSSELKIPKEFKDIEGLSFDATSDPINSIGYDIDGYTFDYDKNQYMASNGVIINDEILAESGLEVGDEIELSLGSDKIQTIFPSLEKIEATIVGTYSYQMSEEVKAQEEQDASQFGYEPDFEGNYNKTAIYLSPTIGKQLIELYKNDKEGDMQEDFYYTVEYTLDDVENKDAFIANAESVTGKTIEADNYDSLFSWGIISMIFEGAKYIIITSLTIVAVLISVIVSLFIRTRRKELGILLALGERKFRIWQQLWTEIFLILLTCEIISIPINIVLINIVSQSMSNEMLTITYNPLSIIATTVIICIISVISTIVPAIITLRLKPKKILL